jgi:hypothetical protein
MLSIKGWGSMTVKTAGFFCAVCFSAALAGCGVAQRIQAQEQAKKLAAQSDAAIADCNTRLPTGDRKTIVARMTCLNEAMTIRMPLFGTDQDLAQAFMANRLAIAEQVQNGKLSNAEGNAAIAEKWSQSVSESQRRRNATLSLAAQQNAAAAQESAASASWAAVMQPPRSVTCLSTGSMTTCN